MGTQHSITKEKLVLEKDCSAICVCNMESVMNDHFCCKVGNFLTHKAMFVKLPHVSHSTDLTMPSRTSSARLQFSILTDETECLVRHAQSDSLV